MELEGQEAFVDKHLERFEEIFKTALREAILSGSRPSIPLPKIQQPALGNAEPVEKSAEPAEETARQPSPAKRAPKTSVNLPPIPVDLKAGETKPGLREFYSEKRPASHYEKTAVFAYYLTKFNKNTEVKYGEILSCYEEVDEKKPSIVDIIKNSIRYKGWLEAGSDKYSCRLTISGENFVKFDLPAAQVEAAAQKLLA